MFKEAVALLVRRNGIVRDLRTLQYLLVELDDIPDIADANSLNSA